MDAGIIGVLLIFLIIIMWQIFSINMAAVIRRLMIGMVFVMNVCFVVFTELHKAGGLLLVFWGVISAGFLLAEYFPKTRGARSNILVRRETISLPEDYLFTVGVAMIGVEIWIRSTV